MGGDRADGISDTPHSSSGKEKAERAIVNVEDNLKLIPTVCMPLKAICGLPTIRKRTRATSISKNLSL
jgi:hypothetical protein